MPRRSTEYLQHILQEIKYLSTTARGADRDRFLADDTLKRAFVRSLEIIGEAVKQIEPSIREKHSEVDWQSIAAMRDRLIHGYFGVDYEVVWDVVENKIEELAEQIQTILETEV